jgi:hypothetical protein
MCIAGKGMYQHELTEARRPQAEQVDAALHLQGSRRCPVIGSCKATGSRIAYPDGVLRSVDRRTGLFVAASAFGKLQQPSRSRLTLVRCSRNVFGQLAQARR